MNFSGSCKHQLIASTIHFYVKICREACKVSCCCCLDLEHCLLCPHHLLLPPEGDRAVRDSVLDWVSAAVALEALHDVGGLLLVCDPGHLHRLLLLCHCHHHLEEGKRNGTAQSDSVTASQGWDFSDSRLLNLKYDTWYQKRILQSAFKREFEWNNTSWYNVT